VKPRGVSLNFQRGKNSDWRRAVGSFAYLYMMAVGFVTAGILLSLAQLVSGKPLGFALTLNPDLASWGGVALRVFAGPNIVMRNAWQMARLQSQSPHLVWPFGRDRGGLEPLLRRLLSRRDPQPLAASTKKEPASCETGSRKGPVGSGMGGG